LGASPGGVGKARRFTMMSMLAMHDKAADDDYPLLVAPTGVVLPPHSSVDTAILPAAAGRRHANRWKSDRATPLD